MMSDLGIPFPLFANKFLQNFEETYVSISTKIVSNKYNYKTLKKSFSNSKVEYSCLCICCNCSKISFFADVIIGQIPLPHVRFCQHFTNPPPPRVLTSYVNCPLEARVLDMSASNALVGMIIFRMFLHAYCIVTSLHK